jgi:SAM-dependent methyltransferase
VNPAPSFDLAALFDADEYLYFMAPTLQAENTPAQCQFIEQALALAPGARVLDLGCGHGRHANELARRGHRVLGVDAVEGFLAHARAEAARERLASEFVQADLRSLDTSGAGSGFDGAVCLFDAFGFHTDEEHLRILTHALEALKPGGRLLLDVRNREHMLRCPPVQVVERDHGDLMIDRFQFDFLSSRMLDRRTCLRGTTRRDTAFSVRLYTVTELQGLMQSAGFRLLQGFGGFDGAAPSAALPRLLLLAERPASPWD